MLNMGSGLHLLIVCTDIGLAFISCNISVWTRHTSVEGVTAVQRVMSSFMHDLKDYFLGNIQDISL